jgi:thymidylate synthase
MHTHHKVADVRSWFQDLQTQGQYVTDKTGCKMIEVIGATFEADEEAIFGKVNRDYVNREIEWYKSMSLSINDIPGGAPTGWKACASKGGLINSNYGYLIWSKENGQQYNKVLAELVANPESRRATMVYTRPTIWNDYNVDGMSDFICTNTVQFFVRDKKLTALVQMRSNDVVFGYKNDRAWQRYVQERLAGELSVEPGPLIWHAGSLHVYERHFDLITA